MVSLLLDLGLDPNEPADEDDGRSWGMPLWFASMCGRHEIAELLISRGADVNAVVNAMRRRAVHCRDDGRRADAGAAAQARSTHHRRTRRRPTRTARRRRRSWKGDSGNSLNVDEPTLTDLAEQMLWAAGSCDAEIVRMCLPHMTRKPDDPWWNYVLMHATLPESFKLVLDHGVDPDVAGVGGHTTLHHLATDHRQRRAPRHPGDAAARCRRVAQQARSAAEVDAARLGLPLGPHRPCQTVPGRAARTRVEAGCRAVGNALGMGHEGRASRDCRAAPLARRIRGNTKARKTKTRKERTLSSSFFVFSSFVLSCFSLT